MGMTFEVPTMPAIPSSPLWFLIRMSILGVLALCFLQLRPPASAEEAPTPAVYNVRLLTDSTPDLTDVNSYLHSITSQHATPQDKAIAIWRWSQKLRKQASNPKEAGQEVLDPIVLFNSYGHCNCGIVSGLNNTFWLNMGWKAHYVQLGDHTVCETSWDDGATWHMFDASMSFYCFNDDGQVASVTEIEKNPRFYLENFAPECGTNPVKGIDDHQGWRQASDRPVHYQRTLANGWDSFKAPNSISAVNTYAQWGQRYVLNLRPGEYYTRYFSHLDDETPNARLHRPLANGKDPEGQHGHGGLRANGLWRYTPNLRSANAAQQVYDSRGITWGDERPGFAARATKDNEPGEIVFKVSAANVVASARLMLAASRATERDAVTVEVSNSAGIRYTPVWTMDHPGVARPAEIDLMAATAGATEYLVRVRLSGPGAGLESVAIETITQLNRAAVPRLARGPNRVQLSLGPQVETIQFHPSVVGGQHSEAAFEEQGIDVETSVGFYKPTLRPADNGQSCYITWKLSTPTPITDVNYGGTVCVKSPKDRVTLLHSWDGEKFTADFEKTDGHEPFDLMVEREIQDVPPETMAAYLRYEFATQRYAKSYSGPGIQMAQMTVHHEPRVPGFTPIEVTYCWVEHRESGDVERKHTTLVKSPAEEFQINVGGFRNPTMKWVRLNLQGSAPPQEKVVYGYSDGQDVGVAAAPQRALYQWGKNLALGREYTLTGDQSDKNPDAGRDLTDGIIAPPDEYVSKKFMPTNVIFAQDAAPVAVIDLGSEQELAAVRVHAGQEPGFHLAFPATITVEVSSDGKNYRQAGATEHNQVFNPPANFAPWENDESPQYAELPAGGRLAYAYRVLFDKPLAARYVRVTCTAQPGWGLMLSEIQAFDHVKVDADVPPPVVLPRLTKTVSSHSTKSRP
jgi:hypothetical protein